MLMAIIGAPIGLISNGSRNSASPETEINNPGNTAEHILSKMTMNPTEKIAQTIVLFVPTWSLFSNFELLFSSDWPHFDFDSPKVIYDIPFLDEQSKRNILGLNAAKLFNLDIS